MPSQSHIEQEFYRIRDVAQVFAVSQTQVRLWIKKGVLHSVSLPAMPRAVRFARADVLALAASFSGDKSESG